MNIRNAKVMYVQLFCHTGIKYRNCTSKRVWAINGCLGIFFWHLGNFRRCIYILGYVYIYLLLLISMLWHRQAIFESKGDKLSSSAEGRIRTQRVSDTYSPADWMPADKPTELSRIKQNLNSTARPYDQQAFRTRTRTSPPDPTAIWHSHLALAIYIFVVVNFDALAQASDIRIERRQVVFLCWRQDSNPEGLRHLFASRLNACWQTDWAIEDQAKLELDSPSLWSASIQNQNQNQPTWPHCHLAFAPGSGDIHICCC